MTIIRTENVQCALCGNTSKQRIIWSTSTFGSPDLDTRPPEMARSLITFQIQNCPYCGYCAPYLSSFMDNLSKTVNSSAYRDRLNDSKIPQSANAFLCYSMLKENDNDYAKAGWAAIHAAWICDDSHLIRGAKQCRQRAIDLWRQAMREGQSLGKQIAAEEALIVDLLRRSRQFAEAQAICIEGLEKKPGKYIQGILLFQEKLIANLDNDCYCIDEVDV